MVIRVFSYGGGVQSTAALILAAEGQIDYPTFVFANTGDDSELPATLQYVRDIAMPYAAAHGIELIERTRGGVNKSLLDKINRLPTSVPIPMRLNTGALGNRTCTADFKIDVVARELKARGATREQPATVGLGISLDEIQRMRTPTDPRSPLQIRDYPLIDARLTRQDCLNIIARSGLPTPERSACWFCPFHSIEGWRRLKRTNPDLFERSCQLEEQMQARRRDLGRDEVWMTDIGAREHKLLREVIGTDGQMTLEEESCDGYCMT